ncbi:MAG: hypothetical protein V4492_00905 [Chlamydiota bacterium]
MSVTFIRPDASIDASTFECSICFDPPSHDTWSSHACAGSNALCTPGHEACVRQWLRTRRTCPLCRAPVEDSRTLYERTLDILASPKTQRLSLLALGMIVTASLATKEAPPGVRLWSMAMLVATSSQLSEEFI